VPPYSSGYRPVSIAVIDGAVLIRCEKHRESQTLSASISASYLNESATRKKSF
jgi:hypothetical protein